MKNKPSPFPLAASFCLSEDRLLLLLVWTPTLSTSESRHSAGLMSPVKPQRGVGQRRSMSRRNSHSQACSVGTVLARALNIPQNPNGALWEGDSSILGRDNLHKEADPAKKSGEVLKAFPSLKLFSVFLTNNAFTKAMPNSLLL